MSDNFKKVEEKGFRYYQAEADDAIYEELLINNKCIVKMFCGTGKSLLMRKCKSAQNQKLVVYVFPSLSLIDQFCNDYFTKKDSPFKVSSENDSTTDPALIKEELKREKNKIICVTYNSYKTLLDNLDSTKINVCIYDEAHHAVGETYQKLIFENATNACEKQIFFTATPKNANGITMYDRNNLEAGMCGKLVYDYSYLRGMNEGYLNPFEIRVDMYTENTNKSVYESIARAILVSGNNRVLTFHADVNTDRDTSVINFVDEKEFVRAFMKVLTEEFPEKTGLYTTFKMIALDASIRMNKRRSILDKFDTTKDNEVYIISSCETIGEGIDTKNANMCVFVDPKSSFVKIKQNIGRIVRPQSKPSTVLILCWVDKTKYIGCDEDREKCDEVIRSDLNKDGNFNGILNVLSALRQEDEDIYDICLHYPDTYSPQEIRSNLEKNGYKVLDQVGDGELIETMEYLLDTEIDYDDYDDCDTNEKMIMRIAEDNDVCVEVHTNSFENQIEKYNSECESGEVIRLYKEETDEEVNQVFSPIVKKCGKRRGNGSIKGLDRKDRIKIDVHTNPDVKVLWKLNGDFTKDMCSCVLDCEVVEYDPMEVAVAIVERAKEREMNGGKLMPRKCCKNKNKIYSEEELQENKDGIKLGCWKGILKGTIKRKCPYEVFDYLDKELIGWKNEIDLDEKALQFAKDIVERAKEREKNSGRLLPRKIGKKEQRNTPELEQEYKDAQKIGDWKAALKGTKGTNCCDRVRDYLDKELVGWRAEIDLDEKALQDAKDIVKRAKERFEKGENLLPKFIKKHKNTTELEEESKDAQKLQRWKSILRGNIKGIIPINVLEYLDINLEGWQTKIDLDEIALEDAKEIVKRAKEREKNGGRLIPRGIDKKNRNTPELEEEHRDSVKISGWKNALIGKGDQRCCDYVRDYLDKELPGWRIDLDDKSMLFVKQIVERANERFKKGQNLLPRNIPKEKRNTLELQQEYSDAKKLGHLKNALKDSKNGRCPDEVRDYLDKELPGWRTELIDKSILFAQQIVERAIERLKKGQQLLPKYVNNKINRNTPELEQMHKDSQKLNNWRNTKCPDEVRDYLDTHLKGWRTIDDNFVEEPEEEEIIIIPKKKSMKLKEPSTKEPKETQEQKHIRTKSELSVLHQRYKTLNSNNLQKEFLETPELWHHYHTISEENEKSFPEESIPRNRIIQELTEIKGKRTRSVVDMGCGRAHIASHFANDSRFTFINYDHVSSKENVLVQDISKTPLEDHSVEICILCLAMWGSNCREYIKEAYRILESGGKLYIMEATKRWTDEGKPPAELLELEIKKSGFKIAKSSIEKFCLFVCTKE